MQLLVDSDIVIEVLRSRDTSFIDRWRELEDAGYEMACSVISIVEVWQGRRPHEEQATKMLLSVIAPLPVDTKIAFREGDYLNRYRASHGIDFGDAIIAATAVHHQIKLWTKNRKHYPMSDLTLLD